MFLLKPRWIILHLSALSLAILFINFGFWQLRRLEQRQARNELLELRLESPVRPLTELLDAYRSDVSAFDDSSLVFRSASVSGVYDASEELLFRTTDNYDGQPGYYLLTPLVLEDSRVLLVKRGWVPFRFDRAPVADAKPIDTKVMLQGTLLEPTERPTGFLSSLTPIDPEGELVITAYLNTKRISEQMPYDLLPVVLELREQEPEQDTVLPLPNEAYVLSEGSHLGYAIQWFAFAAIGVVGYSILMWGLAKGRYKAQE